MCRKISRKWRGCWARQDKLARPSSLAHLAAKRPRQGNPIETHVLSHAPMDNTKECCYLLWNVQRRRQWRPKKSEVLQGSPDLMVLKTIHGLGPLRGFAIARRGPDRSRAEDCRRWLKQWLHG